MKYRINTWLINIAAAATIIVAAAVVIIPYRGWYLEFIYIQLYCLNS